MSRIPSDPSNSRDRMLLASIHDVSPRTEVECDVLADLLVKKLGAPRFAMLVVPDHWGLAPLREATEFHRRLRDWSDSGIEMFVHGWYHRDRGTHSGITRLKSGMVTAGEGEFLSLSLREAARRMAEGKVLVEDIIGRPVAGFIAPAWLYGPGARAALSTSGFALAEDHWRVWRPDSGEILAKGPVVTWASRSRGRQLSSRIFAGFARQALSPLKAVRIALHPGDAAVPALMASIVATVEKFAANRRACRYQDLLAR